MYVLPDSQLYQLVGLLQLVAMYIYTLPHNQVTSIVVYDMSAFSSYHSTAKFSSYIYTLPHD